MDSRLAFVLLAAAPLSVSCGAGKVHAPPVAGLTTTAGVDPDVVALALKTAAAASLRPEDPELRADLALVYEANELWAEAARAWSDALQLDPTQTVWRYHDSICLRRQGDATASVAELRRVVAETPDFAPGRFMLGEMLLDADDLAGAQAEYEATIRLSDSASDPYSALAEVLNRKQDYAGAVELCRRALSIDPAAKRAHFALGTAYRGLGRAQEAEVELTRGQDSVKRSPTDPLSSRLESVRVGYSLRFSRAMSLDRAGNPKAAVPILEDLLRTHPNNTELLNNLAAVYTDLGRPEAAYPLLVRARDLKPDDFAAYINLAAAGIARKDLAEALKNADKAVELAPTLAQARSTRASVYMESQRLEEAYSDLKLAASYDSSSGEVFGRLGEVSSRTGRLREAAGYFEKAANLMPESLPAQASLARIYFTIGESDKALAAFERARKIAPTNPQIQALGNEIGAVVH